jgi:hypothetical protein
MQLTPRERAAVELRVAQLSAELCDLRSSFMPEPDRAKATAAIDKDLAALQMPSDRDE